MGEDDNCKEEAAWNLYGAGYENHFMYFFVTGQIAWGNHSTVETCLTGSASYVAIFLKGFIYWGWSCMKITSSGIEQRISLINLIDEFPGTDKSFAVNTLIPNLDLLTVAGFDLSQLNEHALIPDKVQFCIGALERFWEAFETDEIAFGEEVMRISEPYLKARPHELAVTKIFMSI